MLFQLRDTDDAGELADQASLCRLVLRGIYLTIARDFSDKLDRCAS